jgi:hypothetical protein
VAKQPHPNNWSYLLSVRASIILALSVLVGVAAAGLTFAAGGGWAQALLTAGAATGGGRRAVQPDHR